MIKNPASLYVHIPFCKSKCPYCAFVSKKDSKENILNYPDLIKREFELREIGFASGALSIYFGGGTPLILPPESLNDLIGFIIEKASGPETSEISIESLPSLITDEKCEILAGNGINRVTLGMQSFNEGVLRDIGRFSEIKYFETAVETLLRHGIENIGVDLIIGLPDDGYNAFVDSVIKLASSKIKHISAYFLKIEEGTEFESKMRSGDIRLPSDGRTCRMYSKLGKILFNAGFNRYEISNFAIPGFHSVHNTLTWDYRPYIGLGVSAVSFDGELRYNNPVSLEEYEVGILSRKPVLCSVEKIEKEIRVNERIMLGLRTSRGLDLSVLRDKEGIDLLKDRGSEVQSFIKKGWLKILGDHLILKTKGILWLDTILQNLFFDKKFHKFL